MVGQWRGIKRLWLMPGEPVRECAATAVVTLEARGQFATFRYAWSYEGQPQDGLLLVGQAAATGRVHAAWVDSWNMQDGMMQCSGEVDAAGAVRAAGSYAAPPGPDWGWQIAVEARPSGALAIIMHNVPPGGEPHLAVEIALERAG
jgi:hypothetical protein